MCGRYALSGTLKEVADLFGAADVNQGQWQWAPSYNIAPAATVPAIALNGEGQRVSVPMRWGLHPHWSKTLPEGRPLFNARIETAFEKPSFRTPWKRRRALIPLSGWYEWEAVEIAPGKMGKLPHFIHNPEAPLMLAAGLWDKFHVDEGITLLSCTILTTSAIGPIKALHHRMPVRLPESHHARWLDANEDPARVMRAMLGSDDLEFYAVSRNVNSGAAQGEALILPI